ncbi:thiamine pyrophosphate-binding protein [Streptomyces sp. NRRL S-1448]|uniref:thiamine pyrophosphate-binding protein n=1 Tax=Streptomyces sp. NRRL S-1448 TaxID=1463883 RepID=UPI0007C45D0B|nr:thiamine pyrophosphate-binding protein [Streptomyces sp. NRRL S-1448]
MAAQRITAARVAVQILRDEGIDLVFGCPGGPLRPLYAAMAEAGGIAHLPVRHAEAAVHMADGWARTSGRAGVVAVAAGPGAARLVAGLCAAAEDAVPLVCLIGRPTAAGPPRRAAHRPPDLVRLAAPVTKRAERIEDPARIPGAFREAFRIAREGRPGPVLIDVPADLAVAEIASDAGRATGGGRWSGPPTRAAAPAGLTADRGGRADPGTVRGAPPWFLTELAAVFGTGQDPAAASDTYLVSGPLAAPSAIGPGGPRLRHLYGRSGPPGWEVPAAIGVRKALDGRGERDAEVVVVLDGDGFPSLAGELAAAARFGAPMVLLLHTPDRAGEDFADPVKLAEAYGCAGRDVVDPAELRTAVEWARKEAVSTRRPVLVDVRTGPPVRLPVGPVVEPVHEYTHGP